MNISGASALRRTRIVDFAFSLVLLWDPKGSVVVNSEALSSSENRRFYTASARVPSGWQRGRSDSQILRKSAESA